MNGSVVAGPVTNSAVAVTNGLFTVALDFGSGPWYGQSNWLQIAVETNTTGATFTSLTPRQPITPVPYAIYAESGGTATALASGTALGSGSSGSIASGVLDAFIGGGSGNVIQANANYAFIGGGRADLASASSATVGGGQDNTARASSATVGGGAYNNASGVGSFIGGGAHNTAGQSSATVSGGVHNTASGFFATVGGGAFNAAIGDQATVGGGESNSASGYDATVPGGYGNTASGENSFAVGEDAFATNRNSFVWSDGSAQTSDSNTNQFVARASGGFVFYTSATNTGVILPPGSGSWSTMSDRNAKDDFDPVNLEAMLAKVASLPMSTWSYKTESGVRHIGPMAQDFYAAFKVGEDNKHIADVDEGGVALAAIQGLNQKVNTENAALRTQNARLQREVENLRRIVVQLSQKLNGDVHTTTRKPLARSVDHL